MEGVKIGRILIFSVLVVKFCSFLLNIIVYDLLVLINLSFWGVSVDEILVSFVFLLYSFFLLVLIVSIVFVFIEYFCLSMGLLFVFKIGFLVEFKFLI